MTITHIKGARLTFQNGEAVTVEWIGKGMFHTCYLDPAKHQVYSITIERPTGIGPFKGNFEQMQRQPAHSSGGSA